MLTTNLLPSGGRKAAALSDARRAVRFFAALAVLVFASATVLLFPPFVYVMGEEMSLKKILDSEKEFAFRNRIRETLVSVRERAEALKEVRAFIAAPQRGSPLLRIFLRQASGVDVFAFRVGKNGAVSVNALARTRDDLLLFEKSLRDSGWFESLTIPLASIIQEQDIRFTVEASLKPGYRLGQY